MTNPITGKKILITGGTGSVGQVLIKKLLTGDPEVIRVYSRDEYKQYLMEEEFLQVYDKDRLRFLLGDVRDKERLHRAMEGIDYVFHLAALKHVPACEYNPFEAVKTNVLGTQNIIETALQHHVKKVIYTSSDKAAAPTNTMGASKLLAERMIIAANQYRGSSPTVFSSVRFGNVLNSRGSVLPLFMRQIRQGGPITITESNMTRFFMNNEEASDLIISVLNNSWGGETFVLKMPVFDIGSLALALTRITGIKAPISIIGLRPGEKMYEELMTLEESTRSLETENTFIILPHYISIEKALTLYPNAYPAQPKEYRSDNEDRISLDNIINMIKNVVEMRSESVPNA